MAILIAPANPSVQVTRLAKQCKADAKAAGFTVRTFKTDPEHLRDKPKGSKVDFLTPRDAFELYQTLHQRAVMVFAYTRVLVRLNPSNRHITRKQARTLERFVWHKGFYALINGVPQIADSFARFDQWRGESRCKGEDDPRALPLHVFDTSEDWTGLGTQTRDADFKKRYGGPRERNDDAEKKWRRADRQAYHGKPIVTIAGCALLPGMHWDVTAQRKTELLTSREVWSLPRQSYLNVYPNARIRMTKRGNAARKIWPKQPSNGC
jgi:hypothetical protein